MTVPSDPRDEVRTLLRRLMALTPPGELALRLDPCGLAAIARPPFDRCAWLAAFTAPGGMRVLCDVRRRGKVRSLVVGAPRVDGRRVFGLCVRASGRLFPATPGWPTIVLKDEPAAIVGVVAGIDEPSEVEQPAA